MNGTCAVVIALLTIWIMAWMLNSAHAGGYETTPSGKMLFYSDADNAPVRHYYDPQSGLPVGSGVKSNDRLIYRPYDGDASEMFDKPIGR